MTSDQVRLIQQRAEELAHELEYLLEDVSLEARPNRELLAHMDAVVAEIAHFRRAVGPRIDQEHLRRDFQALDARLHELMNALRASESPVVHRGIARVNYADRMLHAAVNTSSTPRAGDRELIARWAHALELESKRLQQGARFVIRNNPRGEELVRVIDQFAEEAAHFHEVTENSQDVDHLLRDFDAVDDSWHIVVDEMNEHVQSAYLFRRAARVNEIHRYLHTLVGADGEPVNVTLPYDRLRR